MATCEALVNSMPRRVKPVLGNDGGHTVDMVYVNIENFPLGVYSLLLAGV